MTTSSLTATQIYDEMVEVFQRSNTRTRRRFLPGLLTAFIKVIQEARPPGVLYSSLNEFYEAFPLKTKTAEGGKANQWVIITDANRGTQAAIRGHYDAFQRSVRAEHKRLDYPASAPHATQAWPDYVHWLNALVGMDNATLDTLANQAHQFVLDQLPRQERNASTLRREPLRFARFLESYDFKKKSAGPTGAAYQGTVFAYVRADAPHLQVQVSKVRAGSKRTGKVGDVDARDGEALVMAAEVKQFRVTRKDLDDFVEFSEQVGREQALGLVVALDFDEESRTKLREMGLEPVTRADLLNRVRLWDALKQRIAVQALLFYITQVEQDSGLIATVTEFFADLENEKTAPTPSAPDKEVPP